jgi:hypothetical protein
METKNKIGVLVVFGGIALLGLYWFKKNKPNVASSQAKGLQNLSNFYKTGGGAEETFIKGDTAIKPVKMGDIVSLISYQDKKDIGDGVSCGGDGMLGRLAGIDCTEYCKKYPNNCNYTPSAPSGGIYGNQIAQNMQGADFSNLNLGLSGLTFNNIKK